jgi:hypothetical protein
MEFPTCGRGAVQADLPLHLIDTDGRYPIAGSAVPAAGIIVGWSLRF